jgi:membrane protease YdiL (CAAX protease family)
LHLISRNEAFTPYSAIIQELVSLLPVIGAVAVIAFLERRNFLAFNLTGPRRIQNFLGGFAAGFLALSALVAALVCGGWLHFGPVALSGAEIFKFAGLWAIAFLLVGLFEEGAFRCYLQFTLTRGINFWWALGTVSVLCALLLAAPKGNGIWGVYGAAALGLLPCLILEKRKTPRSGFWQAAWVTSTIFGAIHTTNGGENWIGIFAAALIGFVFCVSIYVTGSAWWAIGCHAAWDWAETYFYGTADSGMVATGHYLNATPLGNPFWSGGTNGPEGSLLVIGVILLLLAVLFILHGRRKPSQVSLEETAG